MSRLLKTPLFLVAIAIVVYLCGVSLVDFSRIVPSLILIGVCVAQNTAFSVVSRARNRNNEMYHATASVFSNGVWFLTMGYMINVLNFEWWILLPYVLGTVLGSLVGVTLSMKIETLIGARSDDHVTVTFPRGSFTQKDADSGLLRPISHSGQGPRT